MHVFVEQAVSVSFYSFVFKDVCFVKKCTTLNEMLLASSHAKVVQTFIGSPIDSIEVLLMKV
jgi:hypothetical protein